MNGVLRMKITRPLICVIALLLSACNGNNDRSDTSSASRLRPVALGAPAPDYAIATFAGDSLRVGPGEKLVLLNVWATWCASCKEEFALMDSLLDRHGANGLRVVAVSVDVGSSEPVRRTAEQYGVRFEVAHDTQGDIERRFPALGVPATYLINREGRLVWKHVGVLPPVVDSVIRAHL